MSGQDSRRGTFSQRHAVLVDTRTEERYIPLNHLKEDQAEFCVYDSLLSEAAVLGFDYGYSLDEPHMLIMWEAQFGDFANGAQVIIDQFIASAESKWGRASGLVMLLPARLRRPGTRTFKRTPRALPPALRRREHSGRRPVHAGAVLPPAQAPGPARLPQAADRHDSQEPAAPQAGRFARRSVDGGHFHDVIDDPAAPERARRVLLCSGKVYYDLAARRAEVGGQRDVAIIRLEQLYPWPVELLRTVLAQYQSAREWVWVQEESQNMGAWTFVSPRLEELLGVDVQYVGRDASASPATGSKLVHDREQAEIVEAAVGLAVPHLVSASRIQKRAGASASALPGVS